MNKKELADAIAAKTGMAKSESKKALDAMLEVISETLKKDENVALIGFGSFNVLAKPEHKGINPATKQPIVVPAKKVVKFKAGAGLI